MADPPAGFRPNLLGRGGLPAASTAAPMETDFSSWSLPIPHLGPGQSFSVIGQSLNLENTGLPSGTSHLLP